MAKQLQIRGGTTVQHSTFTGALREITIDTDKDVVVVHDGTTVGGFPLAKQTSVDSKVTKVTSTDNAVVRFNGTTGDVQNSGVAIDDAGNIVAGQTVSVLSTSFAGIQTTSGNTSFGYINFGDTDDANIGQIAYNHSTDSFNFITNNSIKANITSSGDLLLISGTGALGYGAGAGGTVTQLTSKSTDVTLNKPTGTITMSNSALATGAVVYFNLYNSLVGSNDTIIINMDRTTGDLGKYKIEYNISSGLVLIKLTNQGSSSYSEALVLKFTIVKGATV